MPLSDARIIRQNPWWTEPEWARLDPHLVAVQQHPVQLPPPLFVSQVPLEQPAIHVVRGPRQVGKSTALKQLAQAVLGSADMEPRSVIYLALDLLGDQPLAELAATVERAKDLANVGDARVLLLLDEVTAVTRWAEAIKALWDDGTLRGDVVVCTGSAALDLASSVVERLPGRRGAGKDFLVLPQSFADFARAVDPGLPPSPGLTLADLTLSKGDRVLREVRPYLERFDRALERYLVFGGLPAAVGEAAAGLPEPSAATRRVLWDSVQRAVTGRGTSQAAVEALLERVTRALGAKTNWSTLAREMDVPLGGRRTKGDYRAVKDYIEFLARNYLLLVLYFWKSGADTADLSKDKKIYFGDPLMHTVARDHAPGLGFDKAAAVENAMALALYRRYEPMTAQTLGYVAPADLHAWETTRPKEIDFVCGPKNALEMLEVKYQRRTGPADTRVMVQSFPSRPAVLATRDTLSFEGSCTLVPAPLALWWLG